MGRARPQPLLLAALLLALGLTACGGSGKEEQAIRKRVNGFYDALAAKDPGGVCGSLSGGLRRALTRTPSGRGGPRSCQQAMRFNFALSGNAFKNARKIEVVDVQVEGDRAKATASYRLRKQQLGLSKQGDHWLISSLNLKKL